MSQELTYEDIVKDYNELKLQYHLPDFGELDNRFRIVSSLLYYYKKPAKKYLLFAILKRMIEAMNTTTSLLSDFLYNSSPIILVQESKKILEKYKKEITEQYVKINAIQRKAWVYSELYDNAKIAIAINEVFNYFKENKPLLEEIFEQHFKDLESIDVDKYLKSTKSSGDNYYG